MEQEIDIKYFTTLLKERKREIEKNLAKLSGELKVLQELEIRDEGDFASVSSESYTDNILASHQMEELKEIEHALHKISTATDEFGICEMCQDEIKKDRLLAKPFAIYCKSCRDLAEKEGKSK